jgi:hypothetical protein
MHDPSPVSKDDDRLLKQLMGYFDVPAYVRRARRVDEALEELLVFCRAKRSEWLAIVRIRLGILLALAGDWSALRPFVVDDRQSEILAEMHGEFRPLLRAQVKTTNSPRLLRRALGELCLSLEKFNRRWQEFLGEIDLSAVNDARDGYNRYYVLEKECAVRSEAAARHGFRRLEPMTVEHLAAMLPELPVPQLAD